MSLYKAENRIILFISLRYIVGSIVLVIDHKSFFFFVDSDQPI